MTKMTTKLIKATLLLTVIAALGFSFNKQQTTNKYLTMRAIEAVAGGSSKITVAYPDGTNEEFELDKIARAENGDKINKAINHVSSKGYELVSSNGNQITTTYIFVKK